MKYPNPCTRCGMCCLMECCPIVMELLNIGKKGPCPKLYYIGNVANCSLYDMLDDKEKEDGKEVFGFGVGCCIKARAYKDGIKYDFASLSKELKIKAVKQVRRK